MKEQARWLARALRRQSMRWIYPYAPKLHDAVFFRLRRRLAQVHQSVSEGRAHQIPFSVLNGKPDNATKFRPLISIIVPCYNHAHYLNERLKSIAGQSYDNWELILLDDASNDESATILRAFAEEPRNQAIRLICNQINSKSPFHQWAQGIKAAKGDLIWIAESDDSCSPNFLEALVPLFLDEAVMISMASTRFCDQELEGKVWEIESYLPEISYQTWQSSWYASTYQLVQKVWGKRNLIPNASACIFRKPIDLPLLDDPHWLSMRVCGDWIFYLHLARSGRVAYTPLATCHYRQHPENTSAKERRQDAYFEEHLSVCRHLSLLFRLETATRQSIYYEMIDRYKSLAGRAPSKERLEEIDQSIKPNPARKPEVMLATYALVAGGGELAPLRLANLLKKYGYGVSVVNAGQHRTEPRIRHQLRVDIPLLKLSSLTDIRILAIDHGIEIIHSHHSWMDRSIAEVINNQLESRLVVTSHGLYDVMDQEQLMEAGKALVPNVSQFTVVAQKNMTSLQAMGVDLERIHMITNAMDERPISAISRDTLGIPREAFLVCLVSRAILEKGWEIAIQAVQLVRSRTNKDVHLLLVGSGPEEFRLNRYRQKHWIHFLGFRSDPSALFSCSDIGILPTWFKSESRPFTLQECLRAGRPYIASEIGEIKAMLTDEKNHKMAGIVVPLENEKANIEGFADAILDYIAFPEKLKEHTETAKRLSLQYADSDVVCGYENVYAKALADCQRQRHPHLKK